MDPTDSRGRVENSTALPVPSAGGSPDSDGKAAAFSDDHTDGAEGFPINNGPSR